MGIWKSCKFGLYNGMLFGSMFAMVAITFWYGARLSAYDLQHNCTEDCMNGGVVLTVLMSFMFGTLSLSQVRSWP